MSTDLINPFYFSPVHHSELLVGRSRPMRRMTTKLTDASSGIFHHMALLGESGMGKTSLLNMYENYIKAKHPEIITSHIDLDDSLSKSNDPLDIFRGLETTILKELRNRDASLLTYFSDVIHRFWGIETKALSQKSKVKFDLQLPYLGGISWERTIGKGNLTPLSIILKSDFEELLTRAEEREVKKILIMIDEADVLKLLPDSRAILQLFKNTFQNLQGYMIIFSGNLDLLICLSQVSLGFSSLLDPIPLEPLSLKESRQLIRTRLDFAKRFGQTAEFTKAAKEKIVKVSAGSPREIVRLCYMSVETARCEDGKVDLEIVENII